MVYLPCDRDSGGPCTTDTALGAPGGTSQIAPEHAFLHLGSQPTAHQIVRVYWKKKKKKSKREWIQTRTVQTCVVRGSYVMNGEHGHTDGGNLAVVVVGRFRTSQDIIFKGKWISYSTSFNFSFKIRPVCEKLTSQLFSLPLKYLVVPEQRMSKTSEVENEKN